MDERHVVTCFLERGGQIMLLRRSEHVSTYRGKWAGVSGYIEEGSSSSQQAWTEIEEGAGLDVMTLNWCAKVCRWRSKIPNSAGCGSSIRSGSSCCDRKRSRSIGSTRRRDGSPRETSGGMRQCLVCLRPGSGLRLDPCSLLSTPLSITCKTVFERATEMGRAEGPSPSSLLTIPHDWGAGG